MKSRKMIITLIVLLAIGFASISTTLIIRGVMGIATNQDDFNIIFTSAKLDDVRRNDFIDDSKKNITFVTNKLTTVEEETRLDYEVSNTSRIYDGEVSISCVVPDNEYVVVEYSPKSMVVNAGETKVGNIKAKLIKSSVEDGSISITCTLNAKAIERDSLGEEYVNLRSRVLMPYSKGNKIWNTSISEKVKNIIFENQLNPHETTDELTFDLSEVKDKSVMAYAVANTTSGAYYDLYIQSNGNIIANENSSKLFSNFTKLLTIQGLEYFDTSNATDMSYMFQNSRVLRLNLTNLNNSNVTNMSHMFYNVISNISINITNALNTSKVTDMSYMFASSHIRDNNITTLDLSNFNTSKVTDMSYMFHNCFFLTNLDLSNFNTSKVTNMSYMFAVESVHKPSSPEITKLNNLNLSSFDVSNVINMSYMFQNRAGLTSLDLSSFNTSNVINMGDMFYECNNLTSLDLSSFNTSNVTNMGNMFYECNNLTSLDLSSFNTSNVTDMRNMFYGCSNLISLDLSSFNTSNVTDMSLMFYVCRNLTSLNISKFDISKVTNYYNIFDSMSKNAIVLVKDEAVQTWILNLSSNHRPSSWTTANVIIKSL